jgi:DNA-binding LacI/PurR family transcriptional regulator
LEKQRVAKRLHSLSKRVTIKDVAVAAGVSATTVSNVLNDRTEAMSEGTLRRVQETIRALNYRPSSVARSMVTRRTATVGLIIAEIETPLFLQAVNVVEPIARGAGYNILLCNARGPEDERAAVSVLLEKQVDGIIFLSNSLINDDDYLLQTQPSAPPIVLINRATAYQGFSQISWDDVAVAKMLVRYLVELGHRRIAHLRGPANRRAAEDRLRGYRSALEGYGLAYRDDYVKAVDFMALPEAEHSTLALLNVSPQPTAIIAANDTVAATAQRTVQRQGLRVPQDISIVGIDDQPFCTCLNPALTTVQLPIVEAGKHAIQMLLDRISGNRGDVEHLILPCPLIVRESSGAPPSPSL